MSPIARMRTGENRWERVVMVCTSTSWMQCRESWIREISIENLLRRLCIKCEIYVPRFVECFFLAARGNHSLNLAVLDFKIAHLDRTGCTRTPVTASAMISLISVEEIRGRDRSDLLSSI